VKRAVPGADSAQIFVRRLRHQRQALRRQLILPAVTAHGNDANDWGHAVIGANPAAVSRPIACDSGKIAVRNASKREHGK